MSAPARPRPDTTSVLPGSHGNLGWGRLHEDVCAQRYHEWKAKFDDRLGRTVVQLTGETSADLKLLEKGEIIVAFRGPPPSNPDNTPLYHC